MFSALPQPEEPTCCEANLFNERGEEDYESRDREGWCADDHATEVGLGIFEAYPDLPGLDTRMSSILGWQVSAQIPQSAAF